MFWFYQSLSDKAIKVYPNTYSLCLYVDAKSVLVIVVLSVSMIVKTIISFNEMSLFTEQPNNMFAHLLDLT